MQEYINKEETYSRIRIYTLKLGCQLLRREDNGSVVSMLSSDYVSNLLKCIDVITEDDIIKHGYWTERATGSGIFDSYFICSVCHKHTPDKAYLIAPDFCPSCGAKMDRKAPEVTI